MHVSGPLSPDCVCARIRVLCTRTSEAAFVRASVLRAGWPHKPERQQQPPFLLIPSDIEVCPAVPLHRGSSKSIGRSNMRVHDPNVALSHVEVCDAPRRFSEDSAWSWCTPCQDALFRGGMARSSSAASVRIWALRLGPGTSWPGLCARSRGALEGKGSQRRPQNGSGRRSEEVAEAVGGGYCRLQLPLKVALAVRETVPRHRPGALEGGGPMSLKSFILRLLLCTSALL